MKNHTRLPLVMMACLINLLGYAQSKKVFDVFSNEEYAYAQKYKEVKDYELNINGEIDIEYFEVRNEKGMNFDKLNKSIERMALYDWKDKQKKFDLSNEVKAQIANYNNFKHRYNNRNYKGVENNYNVSLHSIDVSLIAACNQVLTCSQLYSYQLGNTDYRDGKIEINVIKYFTFNLFTQEITPLGFELNDSEIKQANQLIKPFIRLIAGDGEDTSGDDAMQDDDESDEVEENTRPKKNHENPNIDIKEANIYWFGWGLMLRFPDYCKSSYVHNGASFSVFIPFEDCKKIIDFIPAYAAFKSLTKPSNNFIHFNYFDMLNDYQKFRQEPVVTSLFKLNQATEKPRKLIAESYQLFKDGKKNYRGDFVYEFDIKSRNFQQQAAKTAYSYYLENSNGKTTKHKNHAASENSKKFYDEKGNLILQQSDQSDSHSDNYFFYHDAYCYTFSLSNQGNSNVETISKISFKNNELCLTDVCLTFNQNMQVSAVKMLKYQYNDIELGFDEKGRLVEAHTENDRYNYYYEYDAYDRLRVYSVYEYQRVQKEVVFLYQQEERLPYLQQKHTFNNDIFEEEIYRWEY